MPTWTRLTTGVAAGITALLLGLGASSTAAAAPTPPVPPLPPGLAAPHGLVSPGVVTNYPVTTPELTFVAIAPCRIANTHAVSPNKIGVNGTRNFVVRGTSGFIGQGGRGGGCGIPAAASAIAATVNTTQASVQAPYPTGYLLGFPAGGAVPTANFMAFRNGASSANPTLTLRTAGEPSLSIKSLAGSTEVVIDVTGYFVPQMEGFFYAGGPTNSAYQYAGSARTMSITRSTVGVVRVTMDRDVTGCTATAAGFSPGYYATGFTLDGPNVTVYLWKTSGTGYVFVDFNYFSLTVHC